MAELNFDLLRPQPTAGASFVSGMMEGQQDARAARTQELQNQVSQLNLAKFKRDQEALDKLSAAIAAHGGPVDLDKAADAMLSSGIEHYVIAGAGIKQKLNDQKKFTDIMGGGGTPTAPVTSPTLFAAPTGAPEAATTTPLPNPTPPTGIPLAAGQNPPAINNLAPVAMGSNNLAPLNAVPVAPPAVPTNALAPQNISALIEKRNKLIGLGTTQSIAAARALDADIALAAKPPQRTVAGPGQSIFDANGNVIASIPALPIKPPAPPSMVGEYNFAKTPEGGNFKGTFQQFVTSRAAAGRAPVQPVAPTITTIVDPTNPSKMITIDARRYNGGGAGSPGVIGTAGKEPSAALRENKAEAGKTLLADEIENLRTSLQTLNAARAIPSTERNPLSNALAATSASGIGQTLGRTFGTAEQTERDVISSAKLRLVNAIKQATGMSAQQLNSNVELNTMLKSLSDPSQSIEANLRNLDSIEKAYVNSNEGIKRSNVPAAAPKANASNIAPIYATNGKTRIQSIDGGVNWTAVGGK